MDLLEAKRPEKFSTPRKGLKPTLGSDEDGSVGKKNGLPSVFVGNLDPEVSVGTIQTLFLAVGEVRSCSIGRKTNKAFATVHLLSGAAVQAAVGALNGTQFNGRVLHVEPYNKQKKKAGKNKEAAKKEGESAQAEVVQEAKTPLKPSPQKAKQEEGVVATIHFTEPGENALLYAVRVGNLPSTTTRTKLRALFAPFGEVKKLKLNQGRGVVWFDQMSKATAAAAALKGTVFEGELLAFEVRLPKPVSAPRATLPVPNAHAADPTRCVLIALYTSLGEKLLQEVFQAVQQIMDAAIALHIPVITADLMSDHMVEPEIVPPKMSFANIATFDATRDVGVRRAITDSKKTIAVVVGVESDIGVLQTTLGLLEMGHTVFVVADAIATSESGSSSFALDRIRTAGGRITTKRCLISEWAATVRKAEELKLFR
jgi:RNA recognition motif-containing protein